MKHALASLIAGVFGIACATVIGAEVRGDHRMEEPVIDALTGTGVVGTALAVRWALDQLAGEAAES